MTSSRKIALRATLKQSPIYLPIKGRFTVVNRQHAYRLLLSGNYNCVSWSKRISTFLKGAQLALRLRLQRLERGKEQMAKYGKKASEKVEKAMHEKKKGTLKSGRSGKKVTSKKQAIAIGLSQARRAGGKVPPKKSSSKKK